MSMRDKQHRHQSFEDLAWMLLSALKDVEKLAWWDYGPDQLDAYRRMVSEVTDIGLRAMVLAMEGDCNEALSELNRGEKYKVPLTMCDNWDTFAGELRRTIHSIRERQAVDPVTK